jgi:hypothetical protein
LRDVEWRAQATAGIVGAIDRFAGGRIGSTE